MSDRERAREMLTLLWGECDYDQAETAITSALAQARAEGPGWQNIATAPKDETDVLVCTDGLGMYVAFWSKNLECWMCDNTNYYLTGAKWPTHWMPLPASPHGK